MEFVLISRNGTLIEVFEAATGAEALNHAREFATVNLADVKLGRLTKRIRGRIPPMPPDTTEDDL